MKFERQEQRTSIFYKFLTFPINYGEVMKNKKSIIIIITIGVLIFALVGAYLINLSLFNELTEHPVNILEYKGISTKDSLKLETNPHSAEAHFLQYTTLSEKRKYNYGIYHLGYKAHCIYDDGNKKIEYDLYEVNWVRVVVNANEIFYVKEVETLFETKHILVMDIKDKDDFVLVWRDLGL